SAYGLARVYASCARFSFAAETIFMAAVILLVFFSALMRRRSSLMPAICLCRHRELFAELGERGLEAAEQVVVHLLLLFDLVQERAVAQLDELQQLALVAADLRDRD